MEYYFLPKFPTPLLAEPRAALSVLRLLDLALQPGSLGWQEDFSAWVRSGAHLLADVDKVARAPLDVPSAMLTQGLGNLQREWMVEIRALPPESEQALATLAAALRHGQETWTDQILARIQPGSVGDTVCRDLVSAWAHGPGSEDALALRLPQILCLFKSFDPRESLRARVAAASAAVKADNPRALAAAQRTERMDSYWLSEVLQFAIQYCRSHVLASLLQEECLQPMLRRDGARIARVVAKGAASRSPALLDDTTVSEPDILRALSVLASCPHIGPPLIKALSPLLAEMKDQDLARATALAVMEQAASPLPTPALRL